MTLATRYGRRPLPDRVTARRRRHGRRLPCRGPAASPQGRAEVPARTTSLATRRRSHGSAVRRGRLGAQSSRNLHDPRDRRARRPAVHRHGTARGQTLRRDAGRRPAPARPSSSTSRIESPMPSMPRTTRGSCIATSSPPTSSSPRAGTPSSSTSASPRSSRRPAGASALPTMPDEAHLTSPGTTLGTVPTCRRNRRAAKPSTRGPISSRSASCSTRWRPARCRSGTTSGDGVPRIISRTPARPLALNPLFRPISMADRQGAREGSRAAVSERGRDARRSDAADSPRGPGASPESSRPAHRCCGDGCCRSRRRRRIFRARVSFALARVHLSRESVSHVRVRATDDKRQCRGACDLPRRAVRGVRADRWRTRRLSGFARWPRGATRKSLRRKPGRCLGFPTVTPDGGFIDFLRGTGALRTLQRVPFLGGAQRTFVEHVSSPIGWSPDGKRMAFIRHDGMLSSWSSPMPTVAANVCSRRAYLTEYFFSVFIVGTRPCDRPGRRMDA